MTKLTAKQKNALKKLETSDNFNSSTKSRLRPRSKIQKLPARSKPSAVKKGRGRPRKAPVKAPNKPAAKRGRGRPRKTAIAQSTTTVGKSKRGRGRPRKNQSDSNDDDDKLEYPVYEVMPNYDRPKRPVTGPVCFHKANGEMVIFDARYTTAPCEVDYGALTSRKKPRNQSKQKAPSRRSARLKK